MSAKQRVPHTKYYWALMAAAIVIGIAGIYIILGVLVGMLEFRFGLRALAIALMFFTIGAARTIDEKILAKSPHLVRSKDRQLLADRLGRDPVTGAPFDAAYGQTPGYGAPAAAPTAYGSVAPSQAPAGSGYGQMSEYGQTPSYSQSQEPAQPQAPAQP
ncbi:MAG: hypothetical protein E7Z94_09835 [Actinomyces ruminicola]|nr:hypothetical protein [Actinomyces ruminicola]